MFSVPGWSIDSSSLKTQKLQPVAPELTGPNANVVAPKQTSEEKASNKRKRNGGKSKVQDVNPSNLADMWETVIEGKIKPKKSVGDKVSNGDGEKRQRIGKGAEAEAESGEEVDKKPRKTKKLKTLKEKRREKKAALAHGEDGISRPAPAQADNGTTKGAVPPVAAEPTTTAPPPAKAIPQLTPLQAAMRQKLASARFRHLNQTLYTTPSAHSLKLFEESPEMFQEYHEGFRRQVEVWPENPVEGYIQQLRTRGAARRDQRKAPAETKGVNPLPRTVGTCYVADLGCGDAGLAQGLKKDNKRLNLKIHSFDLQNPSPLVTKADIANLPLEDGSVDIAIFCLALMGTNWIDFSEEAYRILHWKGELWGAEIKSRFARVGGKSARVEHSVGNRVRKPDKKEQKRLEEEGHEKDLAVEVDGEKDDKGATDVGAFVEVLRKRGFLLQGETDLSNKMFVRMCFVKGLVPVKGKGVPVPKGMEKLGLETWKRKPKFVEVDEEGPISNEAAVLKPCVYKLR